MTRLITTIIVYNLSCVVGSMAIAKEDQFTYYAPRLSAVDLDMVKLPDVTIESAKHFKAEDNRASVDHVQVLGMIGDNISFELLLPDEWNERFVMGGGGLFVGKIQNHARSKINDGYATVGTDTGHKSASVFLADWAYLDLEAQLNFGYMAVHRTAEVSRALIRLYYDRDLRYSYFLGCSTGGRQGLIEASRFPHDFDGIVSGCPVASKTGLYASFISHMQTFFPTSPRPAGPLITERHLQEFHQQVLNQFDEDDGLKDGIINNPLGCQLDWSQIAGLSAKQIEVLKLVYRGPATGAKSLYPGLPLGSELRWYRWFVGPDPSTAALGGSTSALGLACTEFGRYFVFDDPEWTPAGYDLANWSRDSRRAATILNCANPDLQPFHDSDGKLIIWHSWSDGALTAKASVKYFEEVNTTTGKGKFLRLYLLPGVFHCGGGPGPSEINWLDIISKWVERDQPPHRLVVKKRDDEGHVVMTRPIYPYPIYARYKGTGDTRDADNFQAIGTQSAGTRRDSE